MGAGQSFGQSQDEGEWQQLWPEDQMWGVGPAVDLFGKYLGWAPDTGGGAGRTAAPSSPLQCPRGGRLKRPLTHVGNSDCSGDA